MTKVICKGTTARNKHCKDKVCKASGEYCGTHYRQTLDLPKCVGKTVKGKPCTISCLPYKNVCKTHDNSHEKEMLPDEKRCTFICKSSERCKKGRLEDEIVCGIHITAKTDEERCIAFVKEERTRCKRLKYDGKDICRIHQGYEHNGLQILKCIYVKSAMISPEQTTCESICEKSGKECTNKSIYGFNYCGSHQPIITIDEDTFEQLDNDLLKDSHLMTDNQKLRLTELQKLVTENHNSTIVSIYQEMFVHVLICCANMHLFWSMPKNFSTRDYWCLQCVTETNLRKGLATLMSVLNKKGAKLIGEYRGGSENIIILCKCGDEFTRNAHDISCARVWSPRCINDIRREEVALGLRRSNSSAMEAEMMKYLKLNGYEFKDQVRLYGDLDRLEIDFYLENENTYVEVDGEQHFRISYFLNTEEEFLRGQQRDIIKTAMILKLGARIIRIDYKYQGRLHEQLLQGLVSGKQLYVSNPEKYKYLETPITEETSKLYCIKNPEEVFEPIVIA